MAIKQTTANSNNIIITGTSAAPAPQKKSKQAIDSKVPELVNHKDEDGSQEEEVALVSPVRGLESQEINKVFYSIPSWQTLIAN